MKRDNHRFLGANGWSISCLFDKPKNLAYLHVCNWKSKTKVKLQIDADDLAIIAHELTLSSQEFNAL